MKKSQMWIAGILLLTVLDVLPNEAQGQTDSGDVVVTFDEDGTVDGNPPGQPVPLAVGSTFEVYVVAYGLVQISGYEFMMTPSHAPAFLLETTLYGFAPQTFGLDYEVRAGTGGCISDPALMGPSSASWTLCRYDLLYFASENDMYFCLGPSPESGASTPQFALCDEQATLVPMFPANVDLCATAPDGCAVANKTYCYIPAANPSWGSLKAQYR